MIVENRLSALHYEAEGSEYCPTTYDLSGFIPGGSVLPVYVEYRARRPGFFFSSWVPVLSWNNDTRVATIRTDFPFVEVELRRNTPRFALVEDPTVLPGHFSSKSMRINSDQGLFVAIEWAAEYGLDAYQTMLSGEPGPNSLGLVQATQNMHVENLGRHEWQFRFAGGYLSRAHVRVQALFEDGWQAIPLDTNEIVGAPSGSPFRFVADYQLHMEFDTLPAMPSKVLIYRHTPRGGNVEHQDNDELVTWQEQTPSATHALFVAAEIGEELTKLVPTCICKMLFTSLPYPAGASDSTMVRFAVDSGYLIGWPRDEATVGALVLSDGSLRDAVHKHAQPPDAARTGFTVEDGALRGILLHYNHIGDAGAAGFAVSGTGTLVRVLIQYQHRPTDAGTVGFSISSTGTLS